MNWLLPTGSSVVVLSVWAKYEVCCGNCDNNNKLDNGMNEACAQQKQFLVCGWNCLYMRYSVIMSKIFYRFETIVDYNYYCVEATCNMFACQYLRV